MVSFPNWTTTPIPGVSLSASGLLALADLSTVAQRTAITGGSSWLDSLLLAPGLHYQQAAEELARGGLSEAVSGSSIIDAVEEQDGQPVRFRIKNAATALYIHKIARPGQVVTLHVGAAPHRGSVYRMKRSNSGLHATVWEEDDMPDLGWVSHLLYLISPVLTVASLVFVILLQDWWSLASLLALMLSRILNIWVIKQRTKRHQPPPPTISTSSTAATSTAATPKPEFTSLTNQTAQPTHPPTTHLTEYTISLANGTAAVRLRGTPADLQAITADAWIRAKTHIEGYLEAAAKLLVYLVAAFSGNTTQAGAIIMMGLLLSTAGLLALSNANAKSFRMNGRVVAAPDLLRKGGGGGVGGKMMGDGKMNGHSGGVIEGEALHHGRGGNNSGEEKREEEELGEISSAGRGNNTWPPASSSSSSIRVGKSGGGEVGLGLQAGVVGNVHDRAEKGEIRHAGSHTL